MDWVYWLSGVVGSFGIIEYIKLQQREPGKPSGTLTAVLRRWLGIDPQHWRRWVLAPLFAGALLVFALHILVGWP